MVMDEESVPILAEALFDHIAIENDELGFNAGDVIEVLEMVNKDWWWGSANNRDGWFPSASVRVSFKLRHYHRLCDNVVGVALKLKNCCNTTFFNIKKVYYSNNNS